MKNKLGFIGSILGTCFAGVETIIMFLALFVLIDMMNAAGVTNSLAIFLIIFEIAITVITLIFDILSIVASKDIEKMNKKKGIVITAIVFNFISAFLMIYAILVQFSILDFMIGLGLIATAILQIVGLANLKSDIEKLEASKIVEENKIIEQPKEEKAAETVAE